MSQVEEIINELFANDARELHKLCNKEIIKFGGISNMDYDDFYSRVGWDISLAKNKFDLSKNKSFKEYIHGVIKLSIWKEMKHRNREKRQIIKETEEVDVNGNIQKKKVYIKNVSIDAPTPDGIDLLERITTSKSLEEEIIHENISDKMKEYLNNLSTNQRDVAELIMDGYSCEEIKDILHMEQNEYIDCMNGLKAYRNISILF